MWRNWRFPLIWRSDLHLAIILTFSRSYHISSCTIGYPILWRILRRNCLEVSTAVEEWLALGHHPYLCHSHTTALLAPLDTQFHDGCFRHRCICWKVSGVKRIGHSSFVELGALLFSPKTESEMRARWTQQLWVSIMWLKAAARMPWQAHQRRVKQSSHL
jgi:hypothetical protein